MNRLSRIFQRIRVAVLYTTASLLIVAAIALGMFRLAVEVVPEYREDVATRLSEALNRKVRLERMDLRWYGLGPEFSVEGLQLLTEDGKQVALNIGEARAGFTLASLLRILRGQRTERPRYILLKGLALTAERMADGRTRLRGFDNESGTELAWDLALRWLFRPGRADVQDLKLVWVDHLQVDPAPLPLELAAGSLSGDGSKQKLDITLSLPKEVGKTLRLHGLAVGSPQDWRVELVASIDGLLLERLPLPFRQAVPIVQGGVANLSFDFAAENYHVTDAAIDWDIRDMGLLANKVRLHWPLFEGRADWLATSSGWRLDVESAELHGEQPWNLGSARVEYSRQQDAPSIMYLAASRLPVTEITRALQLLPFRNATMREWLQQSHLGGQIDEVGARLRWQQNEQQQPQPYFERVQARVSGLHWQPVKKVPGATNLSGKLGWAQQDLNTLGVGEFRFDPAAVTLDWPTLFRSAIQADLGGTTLQLLPEPQQTRLKIDNLSIQNDDVKVTGLADLQLADDGSTANMALDLQVPRANASATSKYLPVGIMRRKPNLINWLDQAVQAALIENGRVQYDGPLTNDALYSGKGNFQIDLDVSALDFRFHRKWPLLEKAAGHIQFKDNGVSVRAHSGRINGIAVSKATAKIEDFRTATVELSAEGHSSIPQALDFLREGPLKPTFGNLMRDFTVRGKVQIKLDEFKLRLAPGRRPIIKGRAIVDSARLRQQGWPWPVENASGVLHFSESELPKSQFNAELAGLPVAASLQVGKNRQLDVNASGPWPAAWLQQNLGLPNDWVAGDSSWRLTVRQTPGQGQPRWKLSSNLRGFTFNLPAPLAKLPSQRRQLTVEPITESSASNRGIAIRYGSEIATNLYWHQAQSGSWLFNRAKVAVGTSAKQTRGLIAGNFAANTIHIQANTESLDALGWSAAARQLQQHWTSGGGPTLGAGGRSSTPLLLDAKTKRLTFGDYWTNDQQLRVSVRDGSTSVQLEGAAGQGQISLQPKQPIRANLTRLHLSIPPKSQNSETSADPQLASEKGESAPPIDFPGLVGVCNDCRVGALDLGKVELKVSGSIDGIRVNKLQATGGGMTADVTGEWTQNQYGPRTLIRAKLQTNQVSQVLTGLGYAHMLEAESANVITSLHWPGGLQDFALPAIGGELNLQLNDGRLFKVDPGAAKVFGLLSFNTLPRRLAMDFRDVVQPGMAFDQIEGDFRIDEGQARTRNLTIDGPAAKVQISGRTGLVSRDYDQIVQVSPKLGSSVTLAGTVLGGPGVGAALLVGQELFNKPFDKFTGLRYEVTGSWDDPEVSRSTPEHVPTVPAGPRRRR